MDNKPFSWRYISSLQTTECLSQPRIHLINLSIYGLCHFAASEKPSFGVKFDVHGQWAVLILAAAELKAKVVHRE